MGELLTLGHQGQQDGTLPCPLSPQVPGCFVIGHCGASLPGASQEPCLQLLAPPVMSAGVSAGLISTTAIR